MLLCAACISTLAVWSGVYAVKGKGDIAVAEVNGEPIELQWFTRIMIRERAPVYAYFKDRYGISSGDRGFWTNRYGGERPIDMLRQRALDKCVRIKVQQIALKRNGMLQEIDYNSFLKTFAEENARREKTLGEGGIVYGPERLGEDAYFDAYYEDYFHKLKNRITTVPESELLAKYEEVKDAMFIEEYRFDIEVLTVADETSEKSRDAEQALLAIREAVGRQEQPDLKEAARYADTAGIKTNYRVERFSKATEKEDIGSPSYRLLREAATGLQAGEISDTIRLKDGIALIRCLKRIGPVIAPFEAVRDSNILRQIAIDAKYEQNVADEIRQSDVSLHTDVYERSGIPGESI